MEKEIILKKISNFIFGYRIIKEYNKTIVEEKCKIFKKIFDKMIIEDEKMELIKEFIDNLENNIKDSYKNKFINGKLIDLLNYVITNTNKKANKIRNYYKEKALANKAIANKAKALANKAKADANKEEARIWSEKVTKAFANMRERDKQRAINDSNIYSNKPTNIYDKFNDPNY